MSDEAVHRTCDDQQLGMTPRSLQLGWRRPYTYTCANCAGKLAASESLGTRQEASSTGSQSTQTKRLAMMSHSSQTDKDVCERKEDTRHWRYGPFLFKASPAYFQSGAKKVRRRKLKHLLQSPRYSQASGVVESAPTEAPTETCSGSGSDTDSDVNMDNCQEYLSALHSNLATFAEAAGNLTSVVDFSQQTTLSWDEIPEKVLRWLKLNLFQREQSVFCGTDWHACEMELFPDIRRPEREQYLDDFEHYLEEVLNRVRPSKSEMRMCLRKRCRAARHRSASPSAPRRDRDKDQGGRRPSHGTADARMPVSATEFPVLVRRVLHGQETMQLVRGSLPVQDSGDGELCRGRAELLPLAWAPVYHVYAEDIPFFANMKSRKLNWADAGFDGVPYVLQVMEDPQEERRAQVRKEKALTRLAELLTRLVDQSTRQLFTRWSRVRPRRRAPAESYIGCLSWSYKKEAVPEPAPEPSTDPKQPWTQKRAEEMLSRVNRLSGLGEGKALGVSLLPDGPLPKIAAELERSGSNDEEIRTARRSTHCGNWTARELPVSLPQIEGKAKRELKLGAKWTQL